MTENMWLKYTLLVERETEDAFVAEVLASPYTLGWIEPQIEVLTTENGYDYAENTDGPAVGYLFEPMQDSEGAHTERLLSYILRWNGQVSLKEVEQVPEENDSWKEEFREVQVGDWWIAPTWTDPGALETAQHILWIDPGAAFGTGYHGTTQDMLLFLQEMSLTGKKVLDIGTGSGILSLYCVLNGASLPVCAVDINPQSEYQVLVNVSNNHLPESAVNVVIGDAQEPSVEERLPKLSDLILLNIGGDEDVAMLPVVERHIAQGGVLLLSGIVEWNRDHVVAAYEQAGYQLEKERKSDEWITVMLRKRT
ncbi:50S ribosomal protein L11 methyltransferase [Brevibacillus choshinensis]|uniref:Ribosomal protein L11 methyltransferase n=1 Tax=Brevibacillus choshinensis TaxID=54911 RepID=A0ABX7FUH9_BRECH|nr:50S ribosomal protein L11 methyltransferase [Brevibacillus choshinensis]QRG69282.1 50S ribosomal protein L11 methyltransferase [Brevibacillus choshinensis]